MKNFDLEALWEEEQPKADAYFEQVAPQLQQVVRQRSQHVLQKLRRTIILEWLGGIVMFLAILLVYRESAIVYTMGTLMAISLVLGIYPYWNLWQKIKAIPTHSLRDSLTAYLKIIRLFIKRVEWFCMLGLPTGAIIGMYLGIQEKAGAPLPQFWLWSIVGSMVVGLVLYIPIKYWYIPTLYGRTVKQLQTLLEQLEAEN